MMGGNCVFDDTSNGKTNRGKNTNESDAGKTNRDCGFAHFAPGPQPKCDVSPKTQRFPIENCVNQLARPFGAPAGRAKTYEIQRKTPVLRHGCLHPSPWLGLWRVCTNRELTGN